MAKGKGKGGGGRSKNPELRGGKNTLPKNSDGKINFKEIIKNGTAEKKKLWVSRVHNPKVKSTTRSTPVVLAKKTQPGVKAQLKSSTSLSTSPGNGLNKLRASLQKSAATKKAKKVVKRPPMKGR